MYLYCKVFQITNKMSSRGQVVCDWLIANRRRRERNAFCSLAPGFPWMTAPAPLPLHPHTLSLMQKQTLSVWRLEASQTSVTHWASLTTSYPPPSPHPSQSVLALIVNRYQMDGGGEASEKVRDVSISAERERYRER